MPTVPQLRGEGAARPAAERHRLFFALWPDDALATCLEAVATAAALRFGGRPTRRETLHLTLAFLGDVAGAELPGLIAAGRRVGVAPFTLQIDRLGCWRHNRLLWAGCRPEPGLDRLLAQLQLALAEAGRPQPARPHAFMPHLTLIRKLPASTLPDQVRLFPPGDMPPWHCSRFRLVASQLSAAGSAYTTLAEFPLSC